MIKLSDNAYKRLNELRNKNNKKVVRLDVKGGGCAGFNYEWSFADEETRNDAVIDDVLVVSSPVTEFIAKSPAEFPALILNVNPLLVAPIFQAPLLPV